MPVIYMDRASIESLTEKDIREIINENSTDVKYGMLHDYYVGNHRILGENKKDSTATNNRLVNNMAKYIIIIRLSILINFFYFSKLFSNNRYRKGGNIKAQILNRFD